MTDERERLAGVISDFNACGYCEAPYCKACNAEADALIAAGFGDVAAERALFEDAARRETAAYRQIHALQARIDAALDAHNSGGDRDGDQRALDMYRALVPVVSSISPRTYAGVGREYTVNTNDIPRNHGGLGHSPTISTNAFIDFKPRAENFGEKFLENDV